MAINVGMVSLGCSKNQVDSECMLGEIQKRGYQLVSDPAQAHVLVVNTCAFIESAQQESIDTILEMAGYKKDGICQGLIVTGCMAQMFKEQLAQEMPEVDAVLGTGSYEKICDAIEEVLAHHHYEDYGSMHCGVMHGDERVLTTPNYTAYLKIAEGCSNCCAYCAIPSVRGKFRSRTVEDIVAEAKKLAADGVKELIVIAQDISRYGEDIYGKYSLDVLLTELCKIDGVEWIRLHYCYPDKMTPELIRVIAEEPKILKYLDIPVQHSSSKVLKAMNRKGDGPFVRSLLKEMKEKIPGLCLRTSLIVGFPGETEEDFLDLCDFVKEIEFDRLGVFPYSRQENTPAYDMPDQIDEEVKLERQEIIMNIQERISEKKNQAMVGKTLTVLVEGQVEDNYVGRSYKDSIDIDPKVIFLSDREIAPGEFVEVEITECDLYDLYGRAK